MKEIANSLLTGDKIMLEVNLRPPEFNCNACGPFTKNKELIQRVKETGDSRYIYQNKLDKSCIQHDMACGDFKDSPGRTASDKVLREKAFIIAMFNTETFKI